MAGHAAALIRVTTFEEGSILGERRGEAEGREQKH
jgi:hypothetical protein